MDLQVCLPPALAAIHNFIHDLDPADLSNFTEEDIQPGWCSGDLVDALPHGAENGRANNRCDNIANAMWVQCQQYLAVWGDDDDDD